jgi:hypothetical protein
VLFAKIIEYAQSLQCLRYWANLHHCLWLLTRFRTLAVDGFLYWWRTHGHLLGLLGHRRRLDVFDCLRRDGRTVDEVVH